MTKLILENVSKTFDGLDKNSKTQALKDIDLKLRSNEFVSIVGPSGCGKSTMLRLISGLISPSSGSISLDDKKVTGPSSDKGMVFQKPTLFPWLSVGDNVGFSGSLKNEKEIPDKVIDEMLKKVDLYDFKDSYPRQLSGGMAQRVSLIRTMVSKPEVFLLDEPLASLDAFTRMNMQDEILKLWQEEKNLMIMVTHDVEEAIYMSSKVIVMQPRPGRIKNIVDIDLAYKRDRTSDDFVKYRNMILNMLDF